MATIRAAAKRGDVEITVKGPWGTYRLTGTPPPASVYVGNEGDPVVLVTCHR